MSVADDAREAHDQPVASPGGAGRPVRSRPALFFFVVLLLIVAAVVSWLVTQSDAAGLTGPS